MHSLKKTLIAAMALAASAAPLMAQQQGNPGAHFLENWDLNGNGEATLSELQSKRGDVFLTFDSNEDGFIDADEYVYFDEARANDMKANAGGHGGHGGRADRASQGMTLQNNDADQDGKVSRDEFLGGVVAWMGMLDRNTDGVVTTADFGR
ncbi:MULTISPECIES: calcium-binding protein [Rhizobium/Agrobacterium group]|uniref:calcium-binding protein n=1 Tax=Rhizobium/Agrobacterium group TaxID=227290 RepID=UPI0006B8E938|nr:MULTISPECIES: calcium-binding protein [Rhizobium/Agrobacterium group]AOG09767.1 EF-hand domain pair family protein [Agrobacterium sp. RAC06]QGG91993.1 EF-hand domain-containing protein [Agrobacterium sp. MA01]